MHDIYAIEGELEHHIYSPKGEVEGLMLTAGGVPVQFVVPTALRGEAAALRPGARLTVEGWVPPPSHKGDAVHDLYELSGITHVDGRAATPGDEAEGTFNGTVVRLNYAKHGEPNGYVLDSGDFVHTKPDGFRRLGLDVGDRLKGTGLAAHLVGGAGRVFQAAEVNGHAVR